MVQYVVGDNGNWFSWTGIEYEDTGLKASPTTPVFIPPQDTGGLDTSNATAFPQHILQDYTAYARGSKLVGTYIPPEPEIRLIAPALLYSAALGQIAGLEPDILCTAAIGKVVLVCCHLRGELLSYSAGWTLVTQSPAIQGTGYEQIAYIFAKVASSATEPFALARSVSGNTNSYFTWCCLDTDILPSASLALSILGPYNTVSYSKPDNRFYVVCVTGVYWGSTARWVITPSAIRNLQAIDAPRLLVAFDDYSLPVEYTFNTSLTNSTDSYRIAMCGCCFG